MNDTYPHAAGFALGSDTSRAAAESVNDGLAKAQRTVVSALLTGPLTGDEIAAATGQERWAVRPRLAELKRLGRIRDSGLRRMNKASGRMATVWMISNSEGGDA